MWEGQLDGRYLREKNWVYFDFTDPTSFENAKGYEHAFVVAAATNYERCETDSYRVINVELIPNAIITMMSYGVFCSYISTNAVFGGNKKHYQKMTNMTRKFHMQFKNQNLNFG